jgi:hypothetical protein
MVQIVKSIKKIEQEEVYDISVDEFNHYILENGLISHNSGLKYSASSIVFLTKSKDRDGTDVVGNFIKVKMEKSRLSKENKVVTLKLSYNSGLDPYYGLLELAEAGGIIKKIGNKYELPDGRKVFGKEINNNAEEIFTEDIMEKLEQIAKEQFTYGNLGTERSDERENDSED